MDLTDSSNDRNRDTGLGNRDRNCDSLAPIPFGFPADAEVSLNDRLVRAAIYEVHKGVCFWTRSPLSRDDLALDHVLPRSRKGPDNLFNLVPTSYRMNSVRKDAFEIEAVIACLSIIRMAFGPRSQHLLRRKRLAASEYIGFGGFWWLVDPERLRQPRVHPSRRPSRLLELLEEARVDIASLLKTHGNWTPVEDWLFEIGHRSSITDIKQAWYSVINVAREP